MTKLESLRRGDYFFYNDKKYVILLQEGNMSEVKDDTGKRWAWPSCSKVFAEIHRHPRMNVVDINHHPIGSL